MIDVSCVLVAEQRLTGASKTTNVVKSTRYGRFVANGSVVDFIGNVFIVEIRCLKYIELLE
jgi:hypothetical protein